MRGKVIIEGDTADNGSGSNGNASTSNRAGKGSKGKTQRKRSGEGKPAVVITELPYQTNKVCSAWTLSACWDFRGGQASWLAAISKIGDSVHNAGVIG